MNKLGNPLLDAQGRELSDAQAGQLLSIELAARLKIHSSKVIVTLTRGPGPRPNTYQLSFIVAIDGRLDLTEAENQACQEMLKDMGLPNPDRITQN